MNSWEQRTTLLLGEEQIQKLHQAHILIVGLGGVGAYAAELICRAGVGQLTLIDADVIQASNINRQLPALQSTIGCEKVKLLGTRFLEINPQLKLTTHTLFIDETGIPTLLAENKFDFIVDAIDTIQPKCALIEHALLQKTPIISSMGAGAKIDCSQVKFASIWDTYHCGLSKAVRTELKKRGIKQKLPVVFSTEQANRAAVILTSNERNKKSTAGTVSYMPAIFGCYLAQYVIQQLGKTKP